MLFDVGGQNKHMHWAVNLSIPVTCMHFGGKAKYPCYMHAFWQ
jgi:hypothetical protein